MGTMLGTHTTAFRYGSVVSPSERVLASDVLQGHARQPYFPTPGHAAAFFSPIVDNDRGNGLNYTGPTGPEEWRRCGSGLNHENRSMITFADAHVEAVPKLSPITFGGVTDTYWDLSK